MDTLSEEETLTLFKESLPSWEELEETDRPMLIEIWNNYTDALCKDGSITDEDYNNWNNPFH